MVKIAKIKRKGEEGERKKEHKSREAKSKRSREKPERPKRRVKSGKGEMIIDYFPRGGRVESDSKDGSKRESGYVFNTAPILVPKGGKKRKYPEYMETFLPTLDHPLRKVNLEEEEVDAEGALLQGETTNRETTKRAKAGEGGLEGGDNTITRIGPLVYYIYIYIYIYDIEIRERRAGTNVYFGGEGVICNH